MLPKAVVFDVDGVLFDTEVVIRRSWETISAQLGLPEIGQHYLEYVGQNPPDIIARLEQRYGPDFNGRDFIARSEEFCNAHMESEGMILKPGLYDILDYLTEKGVPLALATSTSSVRTARRMELTGLGHYFRTIVTGDMVAHSKPDPEIYRLACQQLGVSPGQALAVEDAPNGIRSAHRAGMQVAMVPDLVPFSPEVAPMVLTCVPSLTALRDYLIQHEP